MPQFQTIIVEHDGPVATVTLNRPEALNALSAKLFEEFFGEFERLDADEETSVIVVTGAGERAFSAGADIKEMARLAEEGKPTPSSQHAESWWRLANARKPVVGALNGLCYGGGALMASCFDLRVGCDRTKFRFLAVTYGRLNSTWSLPRLVGTPVAKELLLTGRVVEPGEALRFGLLNRLVAPEEVLAVAQGLAQSIAANNQVMVRGAKQLLHENVGASWREMFDREQEAVRTALRPTSVQEGFKDFLARKGS